MPTPLLGADAAALRNTLGATIAALLRNLPWGSDAAMYAMAAARLGNASLAGTGGDYYVQCEPRRPAPSAALRAGTPGSHTSASS